MQSGAAYVYLKPRSEYRASALSLPHILSVSLRQPKVLGVPLPFALTSIYRTPLVYSKLFPLIVYQGFIVADHASPIEEAL